MGAPKQRKIPDIHTAINLLNQGLANFRYLPYAFLRGFTAHLAQQCTLEGGFICKQDEEGYCLNPELLNPLRRAPSTLQEVLDSLEASLPPSGARKPFKVDLDYYWIQWLEHANEPGKVLNVAAGIHLRVQMALKHIHHILLHQGQVTNKDEVDLTSVRDWGSGHPPPTLK